MRPSSLDNLRLVLKRHVLSDPELAMRRPLSVLEVTEGQNQTSFATVFHGLVVDYTTLELGVSPNDELPCADESFDVVVTGEAFENAANFWSAYLEMVRVCRLDGVIILMTPSAGPVPPSSRPCYRLLPDGLTALAEYSGAHLVDSWRDPLGPFHDVVGVFRRTPISADVPRIVAPATWQPLQNDFEHLDDKEIDRGDGIEPTWDFLVRVHSDLRPRFYLEIGVFEGGSLCLAACPSVGVDPAPAVNRPLAAYHRVVDMTSDDFFSLPGVASDLGPLDLAYIDGMHQVEHVLKDFLHIERLAHPASVVFIDDVFPAHKLHASRHRQSGFWMGDVWKIALILQRARPDLVLVPINTWPGGSLLVIGLDPSSDVLWEGFDALVAEACEDCDEVPESVLRRHHALHPSDPLIQRVLRSMSAARTADDPADALQQVRRLIAGAMPRHVAAV